MNWKKYKPYILAAGIVEAVGFLASMLTMEATKSFQDTAVQPPLTPPQWLFPIVWSILYALMGVSGAMVWKKPASRERSIGLNLFVAQLILNFFWTLIFFNARAFGLASIWIAVLWAAVLGMILAFRKVDTTAAWLQIPYLLWLTFAAYLTFGVWLLNS